MGDMTSVVKFSNTKQSGKYMKVDITTPDDKRLMVETEKCFSWGIQKSDKYMHNAIGPRKQLRYSLDIEKH